MYMSLQLTVAAIIIIGIAIAIGSLYIIVRGFDHVTETHSEKQKWEREKERRELENRRELFNETDVGIESELDDLEESDDTY